MLCLLIRHASREGEQCTIPQHNGSNSVREVQLVILSVFPVMKMDAYAGSLDSSLDLPLFSGWGVETNDM